MKIENVNVDWLEINSTHNFNSETLEKIYDEKLNIQAKNVQEKVLDFDFFNFDSFDIKDELKDFLNKCDLIVCKQATAYYNLKLKISDFFTIFIQTNASKLNNDICKNVKLLANSILNMYFSFEEIREMSLVILRLFNSNMQSLNLSRVDYAIDTTISYKEFLSLIDEDAHNLRIKRPVKISKFFNEKNFTGIAFNFTNSKYFRIYDKLQECIDSNVYTEKENLYFKKYLEIDVKLFSQDDYNADLNKYYRELLKIHDIYLYEFIEQNNEVFNNFILLNKIYRLKYKKNRLVRFEYELKKDALSRLDINYLSLLNIKYLVIENLISATAVSIDLGEAKSNMEYYVNRAEKFIYNKIKNSSYEFNNDLFNKIFKNDDLSFKNQDLIFRVKFLIEFTVNKLEKSFKRIKNSVKNHFIRLEAVSDIVKNKKSFISYFQDISNDILNFEIPGINLDENDNLEFEYIENNIYQELHRKNFVIEENDLEEFSNRENFYINLDEQFNALYQV